MNHIPLHARFINLQTLIVFLAFLVTLITLNNGFYASYKVQREQLIQQELETNHAYSQKLASAADNFIKAAHDQLAYSSNILAKNFTDQSLLISEVERLKLQTKSFGSVSVVNAEGLILAVSSNAADVIGSRSGSVESLHTQAPTVSTAYFAADGNYVVLISSPIFDASGTYLGYIGGSICLERPNILNNLLGHHYQQDGSYIYVVDSNRQIIYHPDPERIGSYIYNNQVINNVTKGVSGSAQVINSKGVAMLAGYTPIQTTDWGVIAQRPLTATLSGLDHLIRQVISRTAPLALFTFVFIWLLARFISRPLRELAGTAMKIGTPAAHSHLKRFKPWYFEAHELKKGLLKGLRLITSQLNQLKEEATTDPLTGAVNRRSLEELLKNFEQQDTYFSVLAIDIDHFKKVNDTFGHPAGDKVLVGLVQEINRISRKQDIVARTGGEEFLLILPDTELDTALVIAERLRSRVAQLQIKPVGSIQVSVGVSASSASNRASAEVLKQADMALYQAKRLGRNRCEAYSSSFTEQQSEHLRLIENCQL